MSTTTVSKSATQIALEDAQKLLAAAQAAHQLTLPVASSDQLALVMKVAGNVDGNANVVTRVAVSLADILGAGFTPGRRIA